MCGIVGYIGSKQASDVIIDGLSRLEYRGYDSAGVVVISGDKIELRRSEGKLEKLRKIVNKMPVKGSLGIGHTRWATHGKPSEENAHPHTDCTGKIVVVHNGIIENYVELKKKLISEGHRFKSETDTEVVAHIVEKYFKGNLLEAVFKALNEIRGSYALGIISADDPGHIIAARQDAPLIVGFGKGENFIASDIPALLPYTRDMAFLEEGDVAELTKDRVRVFGKDRKEIKRKVHNITWDAIQAEKGGYKHFMLKEIHEQPQAIRETFLGRLYPEESRVNLKEEIDLSEAALKKIFKIYIVACGTSYHSGLVGKFLFEKLAGIPAEVDIASEFRYRSPVLGKDTMVIIITQSGETADTLAALRLAKENKCQTLAICNVVGSTASRDADNVIYTRCGPEIGVASTKAFTGQLTVLYLLAIDWAIKKKMLSNYEIDRLINEFWEIPLKASEVLKLEKNIEELAKEFMNKRDFLYLGRHLNYPIALEGALKLKEISYIHAEGYPAGEMKHGPIALIDENMPLLVVATQSSIYEKILSNIEEAKARGGIVIALATKGNNDIKNRTDRQIFLPEVDEVFSPLLNVIPMQLFAYYVAVYLGCDVDQPRNLAKSVTVE
ncbi:MAG: glutamine--fructose-6-phosphate transaminase (isomerizing) [Elusimicrobia bacterium]|nr:glutamine--fructose-6-phosphate transaminase (isomerizing) [Candidatus Liberimonas magnetica]